MLLLSVVKVDTKLTDYSHANYIPIMDGDVTIWTDFAYVKHTTNLTEYGRIIHETRNMTHLFRTKPNLQGNLDTDIEHMSALLTALEIHHRTARSLNFLGTALKVVAGNPDFDDFEGIKMVQGQLVDSNNRQIIVNSKVQEQINKLTDSLNLILDRAQNDINSLTNTDHLYSTLLIRNRALINELQNLMLSVTLAKSKIINPAILDGSDLKLVDDKQLTLSVSVAELMGVASIKVIQNKELLIFLVKYPNPKITCKRILVFPVQHNGTIINLEGDDTLAECGHKVLAVSECKPGSSTTFCREVAEPTCAQQLHSGRMAHCRTMPSHLGPISLIDEGIIVINDQTAMVSEKDGQVQKVSGTFLILFDDEVLINNNRYRNLNNIQKGRPSVATSSILNITRHDDTLSLPFLHRLSIENLNYIGEVREQMIWRPVIIILATAGFVGIVWMGIRWRRQVRRKETQDNLVAVLQKLRKTEDGLNLEDTSVTPTALESKMRNLQMAYKRVTDNCKQTGSSPCTAPYYEQLEEIFGDKPMIIRGVRR